MVEFLGEFFLYVQISMFQKIPTARFWEVSGGGGGGGGLMPFMIESVICSVLAFCPSVYIEEKVI